MRGRGAAECLSRWGGVAAGGCGGECRVLAHRAPARLGPSAAPRAIRFAHSLPRPPSRARGTCRTHPSAGPGWAPWTGRAAGSAPRRRPPSRTRRPPLNPLFRSVPRELRPPGFLPDRASDLVGPLRKPRTRPPLAAVLPDRRTGSLPDRRTGFLPDRRSRSGRSWSGRSWSGRSWSGRSW